MLLYYPFIVVIVGVAIVVVWYCHLILHSSPYALFQAWLQHHPKFFGLKVDRDEYSDGTLMDDVMQVRVVERAD